MWNYKDAGSVLIFTTWSNEILNFEWLKIKNRIQISNP